MLEKLSSIPRSNKELLRFPFPSLRDGGRSFELRRHHKFLENKAFCFENKALMNLSLNNYKLYLLKSVFRSSYPQIIKLISFEIT